MTCVIEALEKGIAVEVLPGLQTDHQQILMALEQDG